MGADETTTHEDARWWRNRSVLGSIAFRMMIVAMTFSVLILAMAVIHGDVTENLRWSSLVSRAEECFLGSTIAGVVAGFVFGIPLGVVNVLGQRERELELEQEAEFRQCDGERDAAAVDAGVRKNRSPL